MSAILRSEYHDLKQPTSLVDCFRDSYIYTIDWSGVMWVERPEGAGTSSLSFWTYKTGEEGEVRDERVTLEFSEDGFALCKRGEAEAAKEAFPNLILHDAKPDMETTSSNEDPETDEENES